MAFNQDWNPDNGNNYGPTSPEYQGYNGVDGGNPQLKVPGMRGPMPAEQYDGGAQNNNVPQPSAPSPGVSTTGQGGLQRSPAVYGINPNGTINTQTQYPPPAGNTGINPGPVSPSQIRTATPTQTAKPDFAQFQSIMKGKASTPSNLIAMEPELAKYGIKVLRNAEGVAGKIQYADGTIVDVIQGAGNGGQPNAEAWTWQTGPSSGTAGSGVDLGALQSLMAQFGLSGTPAAPAVPGGSDGLYGQNFTPTAQSFDPMAYLAQFHQATPGAAPVYNPTAIPASYTPGTVPGAMAPSQYQTGPGFQQSAPAAYDPMAALQPTSAPTYVPGQLPALSAPTTYAAMPQMQLNAPGTYQGTMGDYNPSAPSTYTPSASQVAINPYASPQQQALESQLNALGMSILNDAGKGLNPDALKEQQKEVALQMMKDQQGQIAQDAAARGVGTGGWAVGQDLQARDAMQSRVLDAYRTIDLQAPAALQAQRLAAQQGVSGLLSDQAQRAQGAYTTGLQGQQLQLAQEQQAEAARQYGASYGLQSDAQRLAAQQAKESSAQFGAGYAQSADAQRLAVQQAAEASRQFGAGYGLNVQSAQQAQAQAQEAARQYAAQYGLSYDQLVAQNAQQAENSRQFGASYGQQRDQQSLAAYNAAMQDRQFGATYGLNADAQALQRAQQQEAANQFGAGYGLQAADAGRNNYLAQLQGYTAQTAAQQQAYAQALQAAGIGQNESQFQQNLGLQEHQVLSNVLQGNLNYGLSLAQLQQNGQNALMNQILSLYGSM